jgi:predicted flap endonuclease-1-like 5' DNA nuclease
LQELESALRAEKELRRHAAEEHQAALAGLRARLTELEDEKNLHVSRLEQALASAHSAPLTPVRSPKPPVGLRRIRGIGPAFQRALEELEVTRVQQVAAWSDADVAAFADKLRIRAERIYKDDWVGQAQQLEPDPEA